ncbi:MAG: hypothetical protein KF883_12805 [Thermomicrobiales bacterium]|nr:hypothetical protein [Thermomicrobiales bacterium]
MVGSSVVSRRAVLFGAVTLAIPARHASALPAPEWQELTVSGDIPAARWDHHLAADAASQTLMVFGGRDDAGNALGDTWLFDLQTSAWKEVPGDGPAARFGSAHASVASGGHLLFGGQAGSTFFNDTWRFDFADRSWQLLDDGATTAPSPRYGLGAMTDPDENLFISHGFTFEGRFDDSWRFDFASQTWENSTPEGPRPLNRCLHEVVAVARTSNALLYGGCSSGYGPCPQGDAWLMDAATNSWIDVTPASGPAARSNPALTWSDASGGVILFGGQTEAGKTNDLWLGTLSGEKLAWEELTVSESMPAPRSSHDTAELESAIYLFGGLSDNGAVNDLWVLHL